jgi:hypothetical protein
MEIKEYNERLKEIEVNYEKAKRNLHNEYGLSLAKFKKGDIITDKNTIIMVNEITVNVSFGQVCPVYRGIELKKDLTPKKNNSIGCIYANREMFSLRDKT